MFRERLFRTVGVLAVILIGVVATMAGQGERPATKTSLDELLAAIGAFLDTQHVAAIHGTNLLAPEAFDELLAKRKDLRIGRTTYVRVRSPAKRAAA